MACHIFLLIINKRYLHCRHDTEGEWKRKRKCTNSTENAEVDTSKKKKKNKKVKRGKTKQRTWVHNKSKGENTEFADHMLPNSVNSWWYSAEGHRYEVCCPEKSFNCVPFLILVFLALKYVFLGIQICYYSLPIIELYFSHSTISNF
jgi:hypothetical protein